jgi:uncharacterized protein YndB with AHSA1/START domain
MIDFTLQTHINRPPGEVFDYVTDPEQLPNWQTNTVSSRPTTDGPIGVGTRLREVHKAPGGKELVSIVEVTEFDPGRAFALHVVEGTPVHLQITLAPVDGGTRLSFRAHGQLTGGARLAQPLLARVLKRQFSKQLAILAELLNPAATAALR